MFKDNPERREKMRYKTDKTKRFHLTNRKDEFSESVHPGLILHSLTETANLAVAAWTLKVIMYERTNNRDLLQTNGAK